MIKTILVGNGYWGSKILKKLMTLSKVLEVQDSKNYDPYEFEKADWVFVSTPLTSHYKIVKDCLNRNTNVFVEKPFVSSLNEAMELIELSRVKNKFLYIDNLFLFRSELLNTEFYVSKKIKFIWHKVGPYNDSFINDLLYHDLYILISKIGFFSVDCVRVKVSQTDMFLIEFMYGNIKIEIDYRRKFEKSNKIIFLDEKPLKFSKQNQDPLYHVIFSCLNESHDFSLNQKLNLQTMKIFCDIKESLN